MTDSAGSSTVAPEAVAAGERGGNTLAYRPHLDGLRALAVVLVVAFHSDLGWFDGGFVGVDVFFVLSGFLVTRLLLADVRRGGRIDFRRFYARRFRRLLPAAALTLVVTAVVFTALASRVEVAEGVGSFKAAFLYVTNWYFIREGAGYFGADLTADPVLHFWSLAVEEQFYLLWPLLLGALVVATRRIPGRRRTHVVTAVVAGAALASAVWAIALRERDPLRAYYGTDARAYQLLAGALLALTPGLIRAVRRTPGIARAAAGGALLALPIVGSRLLDVGPVARGLVVTAVTVVLLTALEGAPGGPARALLALPSVVAVGRISYGIYLWHWPVIWVIRNRFDATPLETFGLTAFVATGLAAASHLLLEQPVRGSARLDRHRTAVIATGLAVSLVGALVIVPRITDRASGRIAATAGAATVDAIDLRTVDLTGIEWNDTFPGCDGKPVDDCVLRRGRGPHVLVVGDSNARALLPAFEALAEREDLTLSAVISGGCPWQRGLSSSISGPQAGALARAWGKQCPERKGDFYDRVLPTLRPDLVVAVNLAYEHAGRAQPVGFLGFRNGGDATLRRETAASAQAIRESGARLLLVEPIPLPSTRFDPRKCLAAQASVAACRYVADQRPSPIEAEYRELAAADPGIAALDADRLVCPYLPICDPVVDGLLVKGDATHLTARYARAMSPAIEQFLRDERLLPR